MGSNSFLIYVGIEIFIFILKNVVERESICNICSVCNRNVCNDCTLSNVLSDVSVVSNGNR